MRNPISATSVEYFIFMIDENGIQTSAVDFGNLYYGMYKEMEYYLVNNSPERFYFETKFIVGLEPNAKKSEIIQVPHKAGKEQTERIMNCYPSKGFINSYSQIPVKIQCRSRIV